MVGLVAEWWIDDMVGAMAGWMARKVAGLLDI